MLFRVLNNVPVRFVQFSRLLQLFTGLALHLLFWCLFALLPALLVPICYSQSKSATAFRTSSRGPHFHPHTFAGGCALLLAGARLARGGRFGRALERFRHCIHEVLFVAAAATVVLGHKVWSRRTSGGSATLRRIPLTCGTVRFFCRFSGGFLPVFQHPVLDRVPYTIPYVRHIAGKALITMLYAHLRTETKMFVKMRN